MSKKLNLKCREGFDEYLKSSYCEDGKTMAQIASEIGCSSATVLKHLRRIGVVTRRRGYITASEKVIANARALGLSCKGIKKSDETKKKMSESKKMHKMGAKKIRSHDGYVSIYYPDYPSSTKEGRVLEHVYVMERHLGRRLLPNECVHHINHIRTDNRIENLMLMTRSEHARFHMTERNRKL